MRFYVHIAFLSCVLLLLDLSPVQAQPTADFGSIDASGTSYHRFVRPGEVSKQVLVLGDVKSAGVYELGRDTDLSQLLSLMGGTGLGARSRNERREIHVRLLRKDGQYRTPVYENSWEEMIRNPGNHPEIQHGDLLMVEATIYQNQRFSWRDGLNILSSAVTLAWIIDRVVDMGR